MEENSQRINERVQRAERLLKQSKKRDYYKILGVSRSASKKEIAKAYRDAAQQWHPDRFQTEEEKATAEKKFLDIAAAKEVRQPPRCWRLLLSHLLGGRPQVLTDPEMRQKFDNGEDPLDSEHQQQRQHNPFHHFHQNHHFRTSAGRALGASEASALAVDSPIHDRRADQQQQHGGGGGFHFKF